MNLLISNRTYRILFLIALDLISIVFSVFFALILRFDFQYANIEPKYINHAWTFMPILTGFTIGIFFFFHLYHSIWKYAGMLEFRNIISACVASAILTALGIYGFKLPMPRSFYFLFAGSLFVCVCTTRFSARIARSMFIKKMSEVNTMIIGAGSAGSQFIKEILSNESFHMQAKCLIDDEKSKIGSYVYGIKVVGDRNSILEHVKLYDIKLIIIAIPGISRDEIREIFSICKETGCKLKVLPDVSKLLNSNEINAGLLKDVEVEDLLGREVVTMDLQSVSSYIFDQVVLVTGGGGTIGSELCRQIAAFQPKQLVVLDIYENSAYALERELRGSFAALDIAVLIASVRNTNRMNYIFEKYMPDVVFHAAAHKHVPLLEMSPTEAVKNNVLGTLKMCQIADRYHVKKFIQISTDKAVNPTNVMGASKRICEMIVQAFGRSSDTEFVAVRFGNVLGSNGSVLPIFKEQLAKGGPLTVTHPDITRYFMTVNEAVSLVLQAGGQAKGGEIFILDMGKPVKIVELAENLIFLSGFRPYVDINIIFIGLRPGEKLYEELLKDDESMEETPNKLIYIGKPIIFDEKAFFMKLDELKEMAYDETGDIRVKMKEIVTTYNFEEHSC